MRKLLFFLCALLTGVSTMWAQDESITLTFNRPNHTTEVSEVEVTTNVDGVTATLTSTGLPSATRSGELMQSDYVADNVLALNAQATTLVNGTSVTLTFEIVGISTDFKFNTIGLDIHAFNGSAAYQDNLGGSARQWDVDVNVNNQNFAYYDDIDIAKDVERENGIKTHKVWEESGEELNGTNPLTLVLTITKGTNNGGCFFGLESITLSNVTNTDVTNTDVTYHLMYKGTQIGESETVLSEIDTAPVLPSSFERSYCTYSYYSDQACTHPIETITAETANIYVKAEVQESELPFELSTNHENAKWYYLYGQSLNKWVIYTDGDDVKNQGSDYTTETYLWAFLGNPVEGIKVINKAETGKYLQSNSSTATQGDNVTMGTEEQVWILQKKSEEGQFLLYNGSLWFNANPDGNMKYWNGNGTGSTLWVYESTDVTDVTLKVDGNAHYATFIAPFRVAVPEGVTAYKVTGVEENEETLVLEEVKGAIPDNTPVVLYSESEVNTTLTGPNTATKNTYTSDLLTGVYTETAAPVGSYVLQNQDNVVAFYHVEEGQQPQVGANHAYLTYTAASGVNAFRFGNDDATGIEAVEGNQKDKAVIYDLTGRRVEKAVNGLYIINGKKVVIK